MAGLADMDPRPELKVGDTVRVTVALVNQPPAVYVLEVTGYSTGGYDARYRDSGHDTYFSITDQDLTWEIITPLRVGQDIKIAYKGSEYDRTYRVVEIMPDYYRVTVPGEGYSDFILPTDSTDFTWRVIGSTTEPAMKVVGSTCRRPNCPEPFNPWAEPTRLSDRTHICFSCRADGWGTTWAKEHGDD